MQISHQEQAKFVIGAERIAIFKTTAIYFIEILVWHNNGQHVIPK